MTKEELKTIRKEYIDSMASRLEKHSKPEDNLFNYHPDEGHIVLSYALFWVMSKPLVTKMSNHLCFQLLHKYQEEMLEAYLTESEDFTEMLNYCNTIYNILPYVMNEYEKPSGSKRLSRKLSAIAIVCAGYGGDIDADTAYDLLDDMDFNRYGKEVCPKIERTHPHLKRMAEEQMSMW